MASILLAAQAPKLPQEISVLIVIVGVVFALGVLQAVMFAKFYRKAPPDCALVRTGHGGFRVAVGSGLFVIPILHVFEYMNLAVHRFELAGTQLDSDQARAMQLPNVFLIAVGQKDELLRRAAMRLNQRLTNPEVYDQLVRDIIFDEYERLIAQMDNAVSEDTLANRFIEGVEEALNTVGLTIIACRRQ
jgi:uncharacterized membrane protein YqiK